MVKVLIGVLVVVVLIVGYYFYNTRVNGATPLSLDPAYTSGANISTGLSSL